MSARLRLARLVTEVLAPAPLVAGLLLVVAWHAADSVGEALATGALAALFASALPFAAIVRGVRRGRLTDHHVSSRQQRVAPLLVGLLSVLVGLGLLVALAAPREVVALVGAMLAGLVSALLVTLYWKISVHTAVAGGAVTILVLVFGGSLVVLAPLAALIGWSRLELGAHTPAQVVAGAGLGVGVGVVVFPLLSAG